MESIPLILFGAGYYVMGVGVPLAMVIAQLGFAWPVIRGSQSVTPTRRTATGALALMCLLSGLLSLPVAASGEIIPVVLAAVLIIPAVVILVRLHQTSRSTPSGGPGGP